MWCDVSYKYYHCVTRPERTCFQVLSVLSFGFPVFQGPSRPSSFTTLCKHQRAYVPGLKILSYVPAYISKNKMQESVYKSPMYVFVGRKTGVNTCTTQVNTNRLTRINDFAQCSGRHGLISPNYHHTPAKNPRLGLVGAHSLCEESLRLADI